MFENDNFGVESDNEHEDFGINSGNDNVRVESDDKHEEFDNNFEDGNESKTRPQIESDAESGESGEEVNGGSIQNQTGLKWE